MIGDFFVRGFRGRGNVAGMRMMATGEGATGCWEVRWGARRREQVGEHGIWEAAGRRGGE